MVLNTYEVLGLVGEQGPKGDTGERGLTGPPGSGGGGGGSAYVGTPTDGIFGDPGPVAGVTSADLIADAFDKVETFLGRIMPAQPAGLSGKTLVLTGAYSAKTQGTSVVQSNLTDDTTPYATVSGSFFDGASGTLSCEVNAVQTGSRALTGADDTGTYTDLVILTDVDPYLGQTGKEGFYKVLTAAINPAAPLAVGNYNLQMKHSVTGDSAVLAIGVDDPGTVTFANKTGVTVGASSYVSGVPGLAEGETITATWDVLGAVKSHYHSTKVTAVSSPVTPTYNFSAAAAGNNTPATNYTFAGVSQAMIVDAGAYSESVVITYHGWNSKATEYTSTLDTGIRVDTLSDESARYVSGDGHYPTYGAGPTGFGDVFDSTDLLTAANNEELQMLGGVYQYPPAVDYSGCTPAGPDYTGITGGSYSNYRWVTFKLGSITNNAYIRVTFNGTSNFGATRPVAGMQVLCQVRGGNPTAGWIDGNAAYPGVGSPTNDGDPAMVYGESTATVRKITFGQVRTGDVWLRVGFPSGSNKSFSSVSWTTV